MFNAFPTPVFQSYHYTPAVSSPLSSSPLRPSPTPSPLSSRSANLPTPTSIFSQYTKNPMSRSPTPPSKIWRTQTPSTSTTPLSQASASSKFTKRTTKPNPLLHNKSSDEEGRETRRKLFLKKVKEGSEDKRWKARGGDEEMMRTIWVMEERRRVARQREALGFEDQGAEESYLSLDELMAEEVEGAEERELEALLGLMEEQQQAVQAEEEMDALFEGEMMEGRKGEETPYGSDDDEYDHIFMDVIQEENRMPSQQQPSQEAEPEVDQDMMDMT